MKIRYTDSSLVLCDYDLLSQKCIASHESNGIDIIVDLVKGDIKLIGDEHNEIAMKLKVVDTRCVHSLKSICLEQCEAAKTLLAVMESRADSEMADRILLKINQPTQLVSSCCMVPVMLL